MDGRPCPTMAVDEAFRPFSPSEAVWSKVDAPTEYMSNAGETAETASLNHIGLRSVSTPARTASCLIPLRLMAHGS